MRLRRMLAVALLCALPCAAQALALGDRPPPLQAAQRSGAVLELPALRGRVVYVDFWASWCAPCREALPALDALYRKYADRGFTVLAVNVDHQREVALAMLDRLDLGYPVVFDPQGHWPATFGLQGMPSGYLLDRDGAIRYIKSGYRAADLPLLEAAIRRELGLENN